MAILEINDEEQETVNTQNDGEGDALAVDAEFAIDEFLHAEQAKDLLRFSTAGSVDDGKSTLIGRLLYDSRNVYEDQVRAVTGVATSSTGSTNSGIDFALLTDGLRAEREQGITIDVAYRYFSTQRRKFIIADTPGHEQYTRNMATGASTADLAIILIDARKGILTQSKRHAFISSLLGIRHIVAAVNKMDLVGYSEEVYRGIESDLRELVGRSFAAANGDVGGGPTHGQVLAMDGAPGFGGELTVIPVSALEGDNVVDRSVNMPWYDGPTLLEHLENVPVGVTDSTVAFRLPVQRVIRPDQNYRGFAGQIAAGVIRKGDEIVALPSGLRSRVASITTFDGDLDEARAPMSIALTLEDERDISRGDVIVAPEGQPHHATAIEAAVVWFDGTRLETHKPYLLKHGPQTVSARVTQVLYRNNIETLEHEAVPSLGMNDVGAVEVHVVRPLFFDAYAENRATGNFILIDPATNATVAAGMIRRGISGEAWKTKHKPALVFVPEERADAVELALLGDDVPVVRTKVKTPRVLQALLAAGVVVLIEGLAVVEEEHAIDAMELTEEALLERLRS
ncbi:sulfate adenylyltransferase subunit 1 [Granulicella aggregans]|uniref:Sulfate adenylyltransferase subunit 1 n=1 Tax=Granulicella aggregans TaxID=474949 RepID=A0A7W7ZCP9_9BACT|nr:GTP-binding protein [Granulicella aggregans]MBB5057357.1 sulfate adenylyltransferase subunit 1 [Granulicella aggregans]